MNHETKFRGADVGGRRVEMSDPARSATVASSLIFAAIVQASCRGTMFVIFTCAAGLRQRTNWLEKLRISQPE